MKKYIKRIFFAAAMWSLLYSINFSGSLPDELVLFSGQPLSRTLVRGVKIDGIPESISASADTIVAYDEGEYEARLSLFGGIANKRVNLRVVSPKSLTAVGQLVGIKLLGQGVVVIGFADFYPGGGLEKGDIILSVNGKAVESYHDFAAADTGEVAALEVLRDNRRLSLEIRRVICDDGESRLGIWVRDSAAGVGTMTFVDESSGIYGALGHGINETDTGVRFPVRKGTIEQSHVASVTKGKRGVPGEITGAFVTGADTLGTIETNSDCGVFGHMLTDITGGQTYPVGLAGEIEVGNAEIICDVGSGSSRYGIKILRVNRLGSITKGILLEITDPELLDRTGGIIQGMSGSPIIQNGKIIGAVTHVLVNDPTCGYGVFIENMLDCAEEVA